MSSVDRRGLLKLLGATGIGLATAACAGPGGTGASSATSAAGVATTGSPSGAVSFAHWRSQDKAVFAKLIAGFEKKYPGVSISQDISPSADYQSSALLKIRGAQAGDVFSTFRGAQFASFVKAGVYDPLTSDAIVGNYRAQLITAGAQDGTQYGLPYQLVFNTPVYNQDAFDAAGHTTLPTDWDAFLGLLDDLKAKGYTPLVWPGGDSSNNGQFLNTMVMNNAPNDQMFAGIEAGTYKATDDWFVNTLKQYKQLVPYMQNLPTGTSTTSAAEQFASGKAAILAVGSFEISTVRSLGAKFPVDLVAPITTSSAAAAKYAGVHNATFILGLNSATKAGAAAYAWIEYLSDPANASTYANGTAQHVTVADVEYTNADLKRIEPWLSKNTLLDPLYQFLNLNISSAVVSSTVSVVGGTDPEQAAAHAQTIIDQQIKIG
jgi:raffinose/stachyose/melibiose transport system substrate-binding protein